MMDFRNIEGAEELFRSVNGISDGSNNIFFAFKNTNREGMKAGLAGGMIGAGLPGIIISKVAVTDSVVLNGSFAALLINQTERGLGIIPMDQKGLQLTLNVNKLVPDTENYIFIENEAISEIKVKNFSFLNKKLQKVNISIGKIKLYLLARVAEKDIPYQEKNFAVFMDKYKKK